MTVFLRGRIDQPFHTLDTLESVAPNPVLSGLAKRILTPAEGKRRVDAGELDSYSSIPSAASKTPDFVISVKSIGHAKVGQIAPGKPDHIIVAAASYYTDADKTELAHALFLIPRSEFDAALPQDMLASTGEVTRQQMATAVARGPEGNESLSARLARARQESPGNLDTNWINGLDHGTLNCTLNNDPSGRLSIISIHEVGDDGKKNPDSLSVFVEDRPGSPTVSVQTKVNGTESTKVPLDSELGRTVVSHVRAAFEARRREYETRRDSRIAQAKSLIEVVNARKSGQCDFSES